jgi:hypothetical protein
MYLLGRIVALTFALTLAIGGAPQAAHAGPKGVRGEITKLKRKLATLESRLNRQAQMVSGLVPVNGVCVDVCAFDSDGDGQGDCVDPCPCDPTNLDGDGDGTPDCIDPCPADPNDACTASCDDLFVPPGHLPPPGECRVWFPDRPPGHQPPPGSCDELSERLPPGTCLVHGG